MEESFYKEISVFSKNGNDHELLVVGEAYISPAEYDYDYKMPAYLEVRNIESAFLVRHKTSKRREDIPRYAMRISSRELKSGEIVYDWEHHRPIELNSYLESEITKKLVELFNDGEF